MKKVTVIGGGSGIFNVLKGLKDYPVDLTSVVTAFDSGGSAGELRDEFGILPPGDLRRSLVALSPETENQTLRDLFSYRFASTSSLKGHSFGNLLLSALNDITGSEIAAIKKAGEILNIKGRALPVSVDQAEVCAELEDGTIVRSETNIDIPRHDGSKRIKKVYLNPPATAYREAYEAVLQADLVVIGPGDLFSSILPNILVRGMSQALKGTSGKVAYIPNLMSKWGETHGFKSSDLVREVLNYSGLRQMDYLICNDQPLNEELLKRYRLERSYPIAVDEQSLKTLTKELIKGDILWQSDIIRHDAGKLSRVIVDLVLQDD